MNQTVKYQVVDTQTGKVCGTYQNAQRARSRRDELDLRYGAIRYRVKTVGAAA